MSASNKQKRLLKELNKAAARCCSLPDDVVQTAALFAINKAEVTGQDTNVDYSLLKNIADGKFTAHGDQKVTVFSAALSAGWVAPKREKTTEYLKGDDGREARQLLTKLLKDDREKTLAAIGVQDYGLAGRMANGAVPCRLNMLETLRNLSRTPETEPAPGF